MGNLNHWDVHFSNCVCVVLATIVLPIYRGFDPSLIKFHFCHSVLLNTLPINVQNDQGWELVLLKLFPVQSTDTWSTNKMYQVNAFAGYSLTWIRTYCFIYWSLIFNISSLVINEFISDE